MVNITHKSNTLREAIAVATITVSKQETIDAIVNKTVPKGDIFEFARAAGLLGIKKTSDLIPDCHPLPIEFSSIKYEVEGLNVNIYVEVHTIYKTGVEVEAMHGASITAITIYDMLKPIDKGVSISNIRLLSKKGGKSDFKKQLKEGLKAVVIVCSDSVSKGTKEDTAGLKTVDKLNGYGLEVIDRKITPDDFDKIQELARYYAEDPDCNLVVFVGGTGLSPNDLTPDAIRPLLTREIHGVMEAARNYGQNRMPYAMLSRGVAGFIDETLVLTLPGSPKGALESLDALFPQLLHVFKIIEGDRHD
jgi:cyclic pyranopterin monophosphate synthase